MPPDRPDKPIRRLKTYPSAQGHVYQYYFVGQRPALGNDTESPATEFVFDVTFNAAPDQPSTYAVSIFLSQSSTKAWAAKHGRPLTNTEQYAAAKLRLFRAFDEVEDMKAQGRHLLIDLRLLEEALSSLGVD